MVDAVQSLESLPVPPGYELISTEGMTVLPGLWDLHVHLMYAGHPNARYWFDTYTPQFENVIMPASAEQMLMAGVTTVRDLAAPAREIIAVKKRIADGTLPGPTLYVAGPALTKGANPNAVQTLNVSGASDAHAFSEAEIRQGLLAGVDDFQHLRTQTPEYPADIVSMIRERVKNGPPLYWPLRREAMAS